MSGRRDSNPRPRPWQGRALPAELLSLIIQYLFFALLANWSANLTKGFKYAMPFKKKIFISAFQPSPIAHIHATKITFFKSLE